MIEMPVGHLGRWVWRGTLAMLAVSLLGGTGAAERAHQLSVVLDYQVDAGLRRCPTEAEFRRAVGNQLGYDPFRTTAVHHVLAAVHDSERGLDGQILWTDDGGVKEGERRLSSASRDCAEFVRGVTFAVAVQIQLLNSSSPPLEDEPVERAPPAPVPRDAGAPPSIDTSPPVIVQKESAPSSDRAFVALGVGPTAFWGAGPAIGAGGRIFGEVDWRAASLELAGEAMLPVTFRQSDGTGFTTSTLGATLAPCGHLRMLALCAIGSLSRARVAGFGVDETRSPSAVVVRAGLRVAVDQLLYQRFVLRLHADGLRTLTPATVYLNDVPVWTTRSFGFTFGADMMVRFQ